MSRRRTLVRAVACVSLLAAAAAPAWPDVQGRAYSVYVNLPDHGLPARYHGDTGWLSTTRGGSRSGPSGGVWYGNVLRVDLMRSESRGDRCKGHSGSHLEAGHILKGTPYEVTWTRVDSDDDDTCCQPVDRDDIASTFEGLMFGGRPVKVTGQPNQTIVLPGLATLVLNERHRDDRDDRDDDCDDDAGEHRALHLILPRGHEVILGAARFDSDDDCCSVTAARRSTWGGVKSHYR